MKKSDFLSGFLYFFTSEALRLRLRSVKDLTGQLQLYLAFMREHNGGEGPLGENNYVRFYRLEELQAVNDEYEVQKWWPGCIVIGGIDDQLWAYNLEKGVYCQIDSCNTDEDTYYFVSDSFETFLSNMDEELE